MRSGPAWAVGALEAFRQRPCDASYVDGQTLAVEYLYAEGKAERYAGLMREVVRLKPDANRCGGYGNGPGRPTGDHERGPST